jgi:hypothetical protein
MKFTLRQSGPSWNMPRKIGIFHFYLCQQALAHPADVCFRLFLSIFSLIVPHSYIFALDKLRLHSLRKRRLHLDALFFVQSIVPLNSAPSYGKLLLLVFLLAVYFFLWLYSPTDALAASMTVSVSLQFLDLGQSVGILGRVISSLQGLYLYTNTQKRTHHPCPEWDSNLRLKTVYALDRSAAVTSTHNVRDILMFSACP